MSTRIETSGGAGLPPREIGVTVRRDRVVLAIAVGSAVLAIAAMAVDHLLGDDPGLEDPPMFLIAATLSLGLAAFVFARVLPRAVAADRAARDGLILAAIAILPGFATLWLGLPFVLAGGGVALGLQARKRGIGREGVAAVALGGLALAIATGAYVAQAVDKLF